METVKCYIQSLVSSPENTMQLNCVNDIILTIHPSPTRDPTRNFKIYNNDGTDYMSWDDFNNEYKKPSVFKPILRDELLRTHKYINYEKKAFQTNSDTIKPTYGGKRKKTIKRATIKITTKRRNKKATISSSR